MTDTEFLTVMNFTNIQTVHDAPEPDDTHAAAKASLQNAAPDAADTLARLSRGEVKGSAAELRVRLDAAKGVLDRVGLGPNTAAPAVGDAPKLTREQMHDLLQRLVTEQGDKALPVTIDAQHDVSDLFD